ncbi:MAG: glycosyltransferase [Candidatus Accumulibacter sp. UW26]|jgi:rhamnosyltransferase
MVRTLSFGPRVAVLLAAFNGRPWLKTQIQSILNQNGVDVSIFVSVDSSDDGTEALVLDLARVDPRIMILPLGEHFGGAARNFFRLIREVDVSAFEFVSLADQDDIWYPEKLERAIHTLQLCSHDCYSSNVLAFWEDGRKILIDKAQSQRNWDFFFEAAGPGCTYVLRRAVVEDLKTLIFSRSAEVAKVGLHDWFIYAFARSRGYRWTIDPRATMSYRQHAANQVGINAGWRAYRSRAIKIIAGWGISQARLIARLIGLDNEPFCRPWRQPGRLGMLWLALNADGARRKLSDRLTFAAACIFLAIVGDRSEE